MLRFARRLTVLYIALFALSRPADYLPLGADWNPWPAPFWDRLAAWIGHTVLGLAPELLRRSATGSGDTTYHYIHLSGVVLLAFVGALAWSIRDRSRPRNGALDRRLLAGLAVLVGAVMLSTGITKILSPPQGISPLVRSLTPYGHSSPMGLAQTYLGHSTAFSVFLASGEIVGGLLVVFRRTRTLGALMLLAAMSNVAMLSLFYDLPSKIFSLHCVAFVTILVASDRQRLTALALERSAPAADLAPLFDDPQVERWGRVGKLALLGLVLLSSASVALQSRSDANARSPLYGIYDVESFSVDGDERPPLLNDDLRWLVVVIDAPGRLVVQKMDQSFETYEATLDPAGRALSLVDPRDSKETMWTLERPSADALHLTGELGGRDVTVITRSRDLDDVSPVGGSFYWVF